MEKCICFFDVLYYILKIDIVVNRKAKIYIYDDV